MTLMRQRKVFDPMTAEITRAGEGRIPPQFRRLGMHARPPKWATRARVGVEAFIGDHGAASQQADMLICGTESLPGPNAG